ncbi:MAG: hypothetical protein RBS34_15510, partial [Desulfofustis sp.]|nr:hypothetical protein [Desulfofustis sp.]
MAIEIVGSIIDSTNVNKSIDFSSLSPLPGDVVVVAQETTISSDQNLTVVTAGYTQVSELHVSDTRSTNLGVSYKVLSDPADTAVAVRGPSNTSYASIIWVALLRGVDTEHPLDCAAATSGGGNGHIPNPAAIETITDGAVVLPVSGLGRYYALTGDETPPTGYTKLLSQSVLGGSRHYSCLMICWAVKSPAGVEDPGAWSNITDRHTSYDSGATVCVAFRPGELPPPTGLEAWLEQAYTLSVPLEQSLAQRYGIADGPRSAWLDQRYGLAVALSAHLEQPYSFLLQAWLAQYYGDVRQLRAHLIQRYGNVPVLRAWLEQLYEDGRPLATWLEQPWQMSAPLLAHLAQRYGIAAGRLETFVEQLYHLHEHPQLAAILLQPYLIGDLERTTHEFDYEVSIGGVPVSPHVVNWDFRRSRYYGTIELGIKEQAEALLAVPGAELAFLFGGTDYHFLVEDGWEETSGWAALSYRVAAHSRTKRLGAPHAAPITGTVGPGLASEVFAAVVAPYGITLAYQIADCYLAPIEADDETPIDLIRRILPEQAVLQSGPAGDVLYVQWDVEVPVPRWFTAPPAATIDDLTGFVQTSETSDPQPGYNRYEIVDQQTAQDASQLVSEQLDGRTMECRQYLSPWDDALVFELLHTAGSHVSIEPFGIVTRTETETVEIVDGAGRTRYPIDAVLSTAWR